MQRLDAPVPPWLAPGAPPATSKAKAGAVVADLGQHAGAGQRPKPWVAGDELGVGVGGELGDGGGQLLGAGAGGLQLA
jgi:hypothetical protein